MTVCDTQCMKFVFSTMLAKLAVLSAAGTLCAQAIFFLLVENVLQVWSSLTWTATIFIRSSFRFQHCHRKRFLAFSMTSFRCVSEEHCTSRWTRRKYVLRACVRHF